MTLMKIDSVCFNVVSGGTPSRQNPAYYENGNIPWLKTGDIKKGFIYSVDEYITELGLENSSAKLLPINSILVAMYGDGNTAGNVAVNKIPLATNQACCNLIINPEKACYLYVYYYLKGSYVNLVNLKSGGSQQNLNAKTIKEFSIWIPELQIQKKIAAILSAYDDLIENNKQRIKLLENMAEELYKEWFVRFRFPNWQNTEFEKGIPKIFEVKKISKIYKTASGGTPSRKVDEYFSGDINWFKTGELKSLYTFDSEERISELAVEESAAKILPENTVVIAMYCAMPDISILSKPSCINQACCAFLSRENKVSYIYTYFLIKYAQAELIKYAHGAAQQNLSQELIQNFNILIAPNDLSNQFHSIVEPIFENIKLLNLSNLNLEKQKSSLLPKLISGKLSVQHLNIHYPPSMQ
jgi:type I restriction enzyme S subunit